MRLLTNESANEIPRAAATAKTMALSEDEQRRLDEIDRALRDDDAQSPARVTPYERRQRRLIASSAVTIIGAVILLTGLVLMQGSYCRYAATETGRVPRPLAARYRYWRQAPAFSFAARTPFDAWERLGSP